ncbi:aspartate carbamoyltransferase regulatory subunit [Clostridium fungisolvens]|uniref:Aspartate carbamoyltransferase regulatory chain n=1 Tax=Clostridium fungisolvens TaxID=1604897 RepID=A0A6V8SFD6_9CLOT|nr:aspartate carbamoyltransferase regulatory subunit [Clostridium fungisolvens]GFP75175.1 Aspartate carbamoyltransferase regulatory chain [Clostridium fungisolvens]
MLQVTSIKKGIVIDHITAGMGNSIYKYLNLDSADYSVALIKNVESKKLGKKDIIKIDNVIDINYEILGLISPSISINIVEGESIVKKLKPKLPSEVENLIKCKNPRCITTVEEYIPQKFILTNREKGTYRCCYCDEEHKLTIRLEE